MMKQLSLICIPVLFFVLQIFTIDYYGQTVDSRHVLERGNFYFYEYPSLGYEGIYQKLETPLKRSYGSLYSYVVVAAKHYFFDTWPLFATDLHAYHFVNIVAASSSVALLGFFVLRIWGAGHALIAMLSLCLLPRFLGHAQTNFKDISTLAFFLPTVLTLFFAIEKKNFVLLCLGGVLTGLTYCVRAHALMIFPILSLWYALEHMLPLLVQSFFKRSAADGKRFIMAGIRFSVALCCVAFIAMGVVIICWPYYRVAPLEKFLQMFSEMSGHDWSYVQLYLGQTYTAVELPWHYPLVYLSLTLPTAFLCLALIGFGTIGVRRAGSPQANRAGSLFMIAILVPPALHVVMGTPMYSGMRHWLLIYPFLAGVIAVACMALMQVARKQGTVPFRLVVLFFIWVVVNQVYQNARLFPFTYIYFNALVGDEAQAQRLFTLDHRKQVRHLAKAWIQQEKKRQGKGYRYFVCYAKSFNKVPPQSDRPSPATIIRKHGAELAHIHAVPQREAALFKKNLNSFCNAVQTPSTTLD